MKSKTKPKPRPRPKPKVGKGFASNFATSLAKNAVNSAVRPYMPYNADLFYTPMG
jgi:hypothetical protein